MTSSVRFAGKPPARSKSSNLPKRGFPPSCMAVASRERKACWTSGGWASRREAQVGRQWERRMATAYPASRRPLNQAAVSEMKRGAVPPSLVRFSAKSPGPALMPCSLPSDRLRGRGHSRLAPGGHPPAACWWRQRGYWTDATHEQNGAFCDWTAIF